MWSVVTYGQDAVLMEHASSSLAEGGRSARFEVGAGELWALKESVQSGPFVLAEFRGAVAAVPGGDELGEVAVVTGSGEGVPVVDQCESLHTVAEAVPGVAVLLADQGVE
jgi:hypothetical protein